MYLRCVPIVALSGAPTVAPNGPVDEVPSGSGLSGVNGSDG